MKFYNFGSIASLFLLLVLNSCEEKFDPNDLKKVIVQGYLFAGQPVKHIQLSQLHGFEEDLSKKKLISDANVAIITNNKEYKLTQNTVKPGVYTYTGNDLLIKTGQEYELKFNYFGKDISAKVITPSAPQNFKIIGSDTLDYTPASFDTVYANTKTALLITWNNPTKKYFSSLIKNTETNPVSLSGEINGGNSGNSGSDFSIGFGGDIALNAPFNKDSLVIDIESLTYYGKHEVIFYRINDEYLDLYKADVLDSRDLKEPPTNVINGLGIFTAFNSDTLQFFVKKK